MTRPQAYCRKRSLLWLTNTKTAAFYPYQLLRRKAGILEFLGQWTRALAIHEDNRAALDTANDAGLAAENQIDMVAVYYSMNDFDRAGGLVAQAADHYSRTGNLRGMALAELKTGNIKVETGDYRGAVEFFRRVIDKCILLENDDLLAEAYSNLGTAFFYLNDIDQAKDYYHKALQINLGLGSREGLARDYENIAGFYYDRSLYREAEGYFNKRLDISRAMGDPVNYGVTMFKLGKVYQQLRENDKFLDCLSRSLDTFTRLGNRKWMAHILAARSEHLVAHGRCREGLEYNGRACDIFRELKMPYYLSFYLCSRAEILLKTGDIGEVEALLDQAREACRQAQSPELEFNITVARAKLLARSDKNLAAELLKKALPGAEGEEAKAVLNYELFKHTNDPKHREKALELYKNLYQDTGAPEFKEMIAELETDPENLIFKKKIAELEQS